MDGLPMEPCGRRLLFLDNHLSALTFYIYRINLLIIFTSMGFVAHSPPNFAAAKSSLGVSQGPIVTELFARLPLFSQVSRPEFNKILNQSDK
jgi:hypothetical protein